MPAKKKSQTAPGEAVYRLNFQLRTPSSATRQKLWLPAGYEASASELQGLVVPALEQGGYVVKIKEAEVACEFCKAHGIAAQKKERYASPEEMNAHYTDTHPGVRSTEFEGR